MAAITICCDFGAPKNKVWHCFYCFPIYFPWRDGTRCHDLSFLNVELYTFSLSSFIFIKRLFSSSSLSAIRVVSSAYLSLLIFLPAILILACASSNPAFLMMYSAYKLNKQGDNIQPWHTPFPIWNQSVVTYPVLTVASWPAYTFLKRQFRWSGVSILFQNFPEFFVIHTVKGFGIVNEAKLDVFLELSCFFHDPEGVGNLISSSFAFSKTSLNMWKFMVHVLLKPGLENFEHYFTSIWNNCSCEVVWAFFGIAILWDWNENWSFPVLRPLLSFQICWHSACSTFTTSSFIIWNSSTGNPLPPLALFIVMLSKAHLTSHSRMSDSNWVITPSWLSGSWIFFFFVQFFVFLPPLLNIFCFY